MAAPADHDAPATAHDDKDIAYLDILGGVARYAALPFVDDVLATAARFPAAEIANALNKNQIASKQWLARELARAAGADVGRVLVLGGWYGVLGAVLLNAPDLAPSEVVSVDLDPGCVPVAARLNRRWATAGRFRTLTADMHALDYAALGADTVINTSCEHLADFAGWYAKLPPGTLAVLQSNDMTGEPAHVNCAPDLPAFQAQAPMAEPLYAGTLPRKRYTRFMLIGRV